MKILFKYFKIVVLSFIILIALRLLETALIVSNFGIQESLFSSELIGLLFDVIVVNAFLLVVFPLYLFTCRFSIKTANTLFYLLIVFLTTAHFFILKYFLYQLAPLDIFLYQYSLKEIVFTVNTSDTSYVKAIVLIILFQSIVYIMYRYVKKQDFSKSLVLFGYLLGTLSVPAFIHTQVFDSLNLNKFSSNKSFYFFSRSIKYALQPDKSDNRYFERDAMAFQQLYHANSYVNSEYPLLHKFDSSNVLGSYFDKFDAPPNIVMLIVEGLNDDFIHDYRGVNLMPFLKDLKDESLYWNRCLSLSERSFAAVPSILGSLPYGNKGFTFLSHLPRHFSLVTILNANDYYTSFFYGQGAWFHRMGRFFRYNNIDLIFDNSKFAEKYQKILVGDDNFFWGYNDKDLLNQSLEVIDTLSAKRRLDIYFTGTSHSPYVISDQEHYDNQFSNILELLNNDEDLEFFETYKKYLLSLFFVDDALEDFFKKYKQRPDYDNTIFVITGDHASTEIPIANSLKRHHVPLLIFSPKLREAKTFSNTVSHLDIYESVLSFLAEYEIKVPAVSTALGNKLNVDHSERAVSIAFMNDNREIVDFYSNDFYLSGQQLYKVNADLSLSISNDEVKLASLQKELAIFKKTSLYTTLGDNILPDSLYCKYLENKLIHSQQDSSAIKFSAEYHNLLNSTAINNGTYYYDISFDYAGEVDEDFSIVYQLSTKNDSTILWTNSEVTNSDEHFQSHFRIPKQDISDSLIYLKLYFWNKNKLEFSYNDLRVLIYEE